MTPDEKEQRRKFREQLENSSKAVDAWPDWKKDAFGINPHRRKEHAHGDSGKNQDQQH